MTTDTMQMALIAILLLCGYLFLYQMVAKRTANKGSMLVIAIVLLAVYAGVSVPLLLIISELGDINFILLSVLLLLACCVLFAAVYGMMKDFRSLHKGMLLLFLVYALMVGYITIFSRSEGHSADVLLAFDSVQEAIRLRSAAPLEHMLLNVVMFIPLGLLFPFIRPGYLDRFLYVAPMGMMCSTFIEAIQMLLRKGQCDVEDIVANTLGAVLGLALFKLAKALGMIHTRTEEEEEE